MIGLSNEKSFPYCVVIIFSFMSVIARKVVSQIKAYNQTPLRSTEKHFSTTLI